MTLDTTTEDVSRDTFDISNCACETCKLRRFGHKAPWNPEGGDINPAVIHNYSYSPRRWALKSVKNDPHAYFLGVELETDRYYNEPDGRQVLSRLDPYEAADLARPKTLWVPKSDSSVSGPEFVSMPATLSYWHRNRAKLSEMFKMLLHAGYRSHDTDRCGMHINISRTAFESATHLFRFLTLIHVTPKWTMRMSQRTAESAARWADLNLTTTSSRLLTAERMMPHETVWGRMNYPGLPNRYCALNAPHGQPRFEFRLPRGTLRIDRFMKNLEWTTAMVEFTRSCTTVQAKPGPFMAYVEENARMYPDLLAFIKERKLNKPRVAVVAAQ